MQLPIPHPVHLFLVVDMVANGPSGGLMLDGDLLAYCSMAICPFTGLFLVAIHSHAASLTSCRSQSVPKGARSVPRRHKSVFPR